MVSVLGLLPYFPKVGVLVGRFLGFNLDVGDVGIGGAFAAEDAESDQIVLFAFGFDVYAAVAMVVFDVTRDVALQGIAVDVTPEPDVEHTAVNTDGISYHLFGFSQTEHHHFDGFRVDFLEFFPRTDLLTHYLGFLAGVRKVLSVFRFPMMLVDE